MRSETAKTQNGIKSKPQKAKVKWQKVKMGKVKQKIEANRN